jgi:hypothetical protein
MMKEKIMTFVIWFGLIVATISAVAGVLNWRLNHRRDGRLEKEAKKAEWSLTRPDHDEWRFERKAPGKVKVYGYTITNLAGNYTSISNKFSSPEIFVKGSKWGIREELEGELQGESWDLTLYYNDVGHIEKEGSELFPKDTDMWVHRLI